MARSRSVTPIMPDELRVGWVPPIQATVFEKVYGQGEAIAGGAWAGVASTEKRVQHAQAMAGVQERFGLTDEEQTLTLALAAALDAPLEHVAEMVALSRVSHEEVQAHAREVGVERALTKNVKAGIVRVVVLLRAIEKLGVLSFEGALAGRSLLGYTAIVVRDTSAWQAVLTEAVAWCYVKGIGTVYDHVLMFGFGGQRDLAKFPRVQRLGSVTSGTEKKQKALLEANRLVFKEKNLASNLKRLTNARLKPKVKKDPLMELLLASELV